MSNAGGGDSGWQLAIFLMAGYDVRVVVVAGCRGDGGDSGLWVVMNGNWNDHGE